MAEPITRCQCDEWLIGQCTNVMTAEDLRCDNCRNPGDVVVGLLDGSHLHGVSFDTSWNMEAAESE